MKSSVSTISQTERETSVSPKTPSHRDWLLPALLILSVVAVYLGALGTAPIFGRDEPRYAQVGLEMFRRHDWVTPTLAGHTWFEKPALLYWLMIAAYSIFGVSEWSARLGAALCGVATVALIWNLARRVESLHTKYFVSRANAADEANAVRETKSGAHLGQVSGEGGARWLALSCAAAMASCAGLVAFSRTATFDIVLTMAIALSLTFLFLADIELDARRQKPLLAGFWLGIGVALLAKGLIGAVLPCGVALVYFALQKRWPRALFRSALWGAVLTLAVAALWYVPVTLQHGHAFIDEFFIQHHFARFTSNKFQHHEPFWYYLPILFAQTLPWSFLLVAALFGARRWNWRAESPQDRLRVFAFSWLLVPLAFFSLSGSKLPGYIAPALPGAMLLAGIELAAFARGEDRTNAMRATGVLMLLMALVVLIFGERSLEITRSSVALVAVPLLIGASVLMFARRRGMRSLAAPGAMLLATFFVVVVALPQATRENSVRDLIALASARGYAQTPVLQWHLEGETIERTSQWYAADRLIYDEHGEPLNARDDTIVIEQLRQHGGQLLLLSPIEGALEIETSPRLEAKRLGDNGKFALLLARARNATTAQ